MGRLAVSLNDIQTGHLSLEGAGDIGIHPVLEHFSGNALYRADELGFLQGAVAHDHGFLEHLAIHGKQEIHAAASVQGHTCLNITQAAADKLGIRGNGDGEAAVRIYQSGIPAALFHHDRSEYGLSRLGVFCRSADLHAPLCEGSRSSKRKARKNCNGF